MKKLTLALIALVTLAGCANLDVGFNRQRPDWLRDPAHGEYPYNSRGW